MKGFAISLALKQRLKETRKCACPIGFCCLSGPGYSSLTLCRHSLGKECVTSPKNACARGCGYSCCSVKGYHRFATFQIKTPVETFPRFPSIIHDIWSRANFSKVKSFFEFTLASGLFVCEWIQDYGCC